MAWLLLGGLALVVVLRFARRRRKFSNVGPSQSLGPLNVALSKRQTAKKRAALDAATAALR
jgi:hypothetical protein